MFRRKDKKESSASIAVYAMLIVLALMFTAPNILKAERIIVPDNYPSIQQALNAASTGDTVYVREGTYSERVTISKSLTLEGESRDGTVIDGSGSGDVIYITASYVTVNRLTATNGEYGVVLIADYSINHVTIRDMIITANSSTAISAGHSHSSDACHVIDNCIISHNGGGASYAHQFSRSVIQNCEVFGNGSGLGVAWGANSTISNNRIYDNDGPGITLDSNSYTIVERNEISENTTGIHVGYVGNNNIIRENTVRNNGTGINMGGPYVHSNKIYHNDLTYNTNRQAYDAEGDNEWNDGYPSGGNYWSDYAGMDEYGGENQDILGSDGIGDSPYAFENTQDVYPLMSPFNASEILQATLDIRPGSCPNPFNPRSQGVLPVAILGTVEFDIVDIDPTTILLEGVQPLRWNIEDVATPVSNGDNCACTNDGSDGFDDLTLKFSTPEIVSTFEGFSVGEEKYLTITGSLTDGTAFEASDCVIIRGRKEEKLVKDDSHDRRLLLKSDLTDPVQIISYELPKQSYVEATVYDVSGRVVARLKSSVESAGMQTVQWNTSGLASGMYFLQVRAGELQMTRKMLILR